MYALGITHNRFLLNYKKSKRTAQPVGLNTLGSQKLPKSVIENIGINFLH